MATLESVVTLLVGLLIGGLAIHVAAIFVAGRNDLSHAIVTAGIAAVAWAIVTWLAGPIPLLGGELAVLLGLVAYIWVVKWRYRGGWVRAAILAGLAWLTVSVALELLAPVLSLPDVVGIPFV